ncbi:MAG: endolytic transglycosylase MltG [Oscillospiraceae bacterium]|jgi:UPF0755 protein|nr:endolytic transglycosylase MltG [Oscillospiraceae bacterium]
MDDEYEKVDFPQEKNPEPKFDVNFDFEGEYNDVPDDAPLHRRRTRRTGCLGGVMFLIVIICVSLVLASILWLAATDVLGFGGADKLVIITVPRAFTMDEVTENLRDLGLIKYEGLFKLYSKFSHSEETIVPGTYELNLSYDYRAIVYGMSAKSGARVTTGVTFPEGLTMAQMFKLLDETGVCSAEDLWLAATNTEFDYAFLEGTETGDRHRLEGFLFPDTYTFWLGDSPARVLRKMLDTFELRFQAEWYTKAEELGYTPREIIIIASIIEREAGAESDRTKIASVIYNRLKSSDIKRLEIDATIYYAIAETGEKFSTSVESPYNTYRVEGLPPGAISNPGVASIKAALNPDKTGFYYYALTKDEDRHHAFFGTYEEQRKFVESDQYGG